MFAFLYSFLALQRIIELQIAKKNEQKMKKLGAVEYGKGHYIWIVLMHICFFISFLIESAFHQWKLSPYWPFIIVILLFTQLLRYWSIASLGMYWNTKIIVLKNANVQVRGPYRYIRHPNYVAVTIELLFIPLLFDAFLTAITFTIFNIILLSIRIKAEERVLEEETDYLNTFSKKMRFIPKK